MTSGSLAPKEVTEGFVFLTFPLMNPTVMDDSKQEHKTRTYIRAHRHTFRCNPTNSEVSWRLESQSCAYSYGCYFFYVGSNSKRVNSHVGTENVRENNSIVWVDQETLDGVPSLLAREIWIMDSLRWVPPLRQGQKMFEVYSNNVKNFKDWYFLVTLFTNVVHVSMCDVQFQLPFKYLG